MSRRPPVNKTNAFAALMNSATKSQANEAKIPKGKAPINSRSTTKQPIEELPISKKRRLVRRAPLREDPQPEDTPPMEDYSRPMLMGPEQDLEITTMLASPIAQNETRLAIRTRAQVETGFGTLYMIYSDKGASKQFMELLGLALGQVSFPTFAEFCKAKCNAPVSSDDPSFIHLIAVDVTTSPTVSDAFIPVPDFISFVCRLLTPVDEVDWNNDAARDIHKGWLFNVSNVSMIPDFLLVFVYMMESSYILNLFPNISMSNELWQFDDGDYVQQSIVRPSFYLLCNRMSMLMVNIGTLFYEIRNHYAMPEEFGRDNIVLASIISVFDHFTGAIDVVEDSIKVIKDSIGINPRMIIYFNKVAQLLSGPIANPVSPTDDDTINNITGSKNDLTLAIVSLSRYMSSSVGPRKPVGVDMCLAVDRLSSISGDDLTVDAREFMMATIAACGGKDGHKLYTATGGKIVLLSNKIRQCEYDLPIISTGVVDATAIMCHMLHSHQMTKAAKDAMISVSTYDIWFAPSNAISGTRVVYNSICSLLSPLLTHQTVCLPLMLFPYLASAYSNSTNGWFEVVMIVAFIHTRDYSFARAFLNDIFSSMFGDNLQVTIDTFTHALPMVLGNYFRSGGVENAHKISKLILIMTGMMKVSCKKDGCLQNVISSMEAQIDKEDNLWSELTGAPSTNNCVVASKIIYTLSISEDNKVWHAFVDELEIVCPTSVFKKEDEAKMATLKELQSVVMSNSMPFECAKQEAQTVYDFTELRFTENRDVIDHLALMNALRIIECEFRGFALAESEELFTKCYGAFQRQWSSPIRLLHPIFKLFNDSETIKLPLFLDGVSVTGKNTDLVLHPQCHVCVHDKSFADPIREPAEVLRRVVEKKHICGSPWYGVSRPLARCMADYERKGKEKDFINFVELGNRIQENNAKNYEPAIGVMEYVNKLIEEQIPNNDLFTSGQDYDYFNN